MAEGEVQITLGDPNSEADQKKETLRCTPRAARTISAACGGFVEAFRLLAAFEHSTYVTVVAAGLNRPPQQVEEDVYKTGLTQLTEPLSEYLALLTNGGRPSTRETPSTGEG